MDHLQSFDVVVVGGGPGGSMAAKRCAESGFTTLLIERKKLPRDKVCTGLVMGDWAGRTIEEEFGKIPETVLTDPPSVAGHRLYVAGAEPQTLEWPTPLAWRRDLDFWMLQKAKEAGVVVREATPVVHITPGSRCVSRHMPFGRGDREYSGEVCHWSRRSNFRCAQIDVSGIQSPLRSACQGLLRRSIGPGTELDSLVLSQRPLKTTV